LARINTATATLLFRLVNYHANSTNTNAFTIARPVHNDIIVAMPPKAKQRAVKAPSKPIPEPFSPAPEELADLLSTFSRDTVYITYVKL